MTFMRRTDCENLYVIFYVDISSLILFIFISRGHADAEIEAVFARYDLDGDRILDEDEQRRMQEDLEGQKVQKLDCFFTFFKIIIQSLKYYKSLANL